MVDYFANFLFDHQTLRVCSEIVRDVSNRQTLRVCSQIAPGLINVACVQPNRSRLPARTCPLAKRYVCAAKSLAGRQTLYVCSHSIRGSIGQPELSR